MIYIDMPKICNINVKSKSSIGSNARKKGDISMIKNVNKRSREKYSVSLYRKADYKSGLKRVLSSSKSRDINTKMISTLYSYLKLKEYLEKHRSNLILEDLFYPTVFTSPEALLQEIKLLKRLRVTRMISVIISREKKIKIKDIEDVANKLCESCKYKDEKFKILEFYEFFIFELAKKLDFVKIVI